MSQTPQRPLPNGLRAVPAFNARPRRATSLTRDASIAASLGAPAQPGEDEEREDDPIHTMLKARCAQTEMSIAGLFAPGGGQRARSARSSPSRDHASDQAARPEDNAKPSAPPKKAARTIEDDYGDDDEEDEEDEEGDGEETDAEEVGGELDGAGSGGRHGRRVIWGAVTVVVVEIGVGDIEL